MSRIGNCFEVLKEHKKKALVVYMTAGDPDLEWSYKAAKAAIEGGADILEVGVPFSDPVADGPVIQEAMGRALQSGGGLSLSLALVRRVREVSHIPIVLFGYLNPLLHGGFKNTIQRVSDAGVDGLLVVDLPPEEAQPYREVAAKEGMDWVSLVAPTSGPQRTATIAAAATGFIYLVSMTGVTGGELKALGPVKKMIDVVRECSSLPACVGFGVRDAPSAARLGKLADGVVVGSEIVRTLKAGMESGTGVKPVLELIRSLRAGLDSAT